MLPLGRSTVLWRHQTVAQVGEVFAVREGTHHGEAIAQDEAVRPIHVVLVELHGFAVFLLRVGKQFALDILACRDSQDGFCAYSFVDMQRHRIDGEGFCLLFARPFEPRGAVFQGVGEEFDFVVGESVLCLFEEFGDLVGVAGVVESEDGRQVGVVGVFLLWSFSRSPPWEAMPAGGLFRRVASSWR